MNSIPSALASRGERISMGALFILISPLSRAMAPPRIFISVDLPAPFSPIKATISPAPTLRLTLSSATTPGNRLLTPSISSMGLFAVICSATDKHGRTLTDYSSRGSTVRVSPCRSVALTAPAELVDLLLERVNVCSLHRDGWNEDLLRRRYD